jgi:hypothetical protein
MKKSIVKALIFGGTMALSMTAMAGTITVKLNYEDGSSCSGCRVGNDYTFKDSFTDSSGVAEMDVGDASRAITVYVDGSSAACARAGDSIQIAVKGCGMADTCPVNGGGC